MTPVKDSLDLKTRQRIAANLRQLKHMHGFASTAAMATEIGMSRSALNRYLKDERTAGLDVLLLVHRTLHVSIDWIVDRDPPQEWLDPEFKPVAAARPKKR